MASFKGYKRSIKLEFDYEDIKKGVPNVSKQMAILNAEFKKSSAEAEASGKEIDKLRVKYEYLQNKLKIQEQVVEEYTQKLQKATEAKGNNTKAIQNNTVELEKAKAQLAQTKAELEKVSKELDKQQTFLGKTSKEWEKLGDKLTDIGKSMTMKLTAPIVAAGTAAFKVGADFEQAIGKLNAVFGQSSARIEQWAQNSLQNFGLARNTAIEMVADFGALFQGVGINIRKTEEWSKTLTERAMDLANFYNTTIDETINALNAIVTGQTEPLRKFGINMTQATLQEYAYSKGIRKKIQDMTEAEKVQLRYNFVMEKTAIAVGTTARESDTATGQLNRFKESVKELGLSFSEQILPIVTPIIEGITNLIQKFSNLSDGTKKFIVVLGGIVAVAGPVLLTLGSIFGAISKISSGIEAIPKVIDGLSKAGKAFSGLLDTTQFLGFAKWALIIAGVALAIAALVVAINYLIGKGKEMNEFARNMNEMVGSIGNTVQNTRIRGYAAGTKYHPGGLAIVGEEGPELVNLPRGSQVYTAQETRALLSGGDTFILQVNMNEIDEVYKLKNVFEQFRQVKRAGRAVT